MAADATHSMESLPFLVTHWLANFGVAGTINTDSEEQRRALERIHAASAEIASAFSSLGAFGTKIPPSISASWNQEVRSQNANYSDVRRRWNGLSPSHLDQIAYAMASTNAVVDSICSNQINLLEAIHEGGLNAGGGRTVQDAIRVDDGQASKEISPEVHALAVLQSPSLLTPSQPLDQKFDLSNIEAERPASSPPLLQARSSYVEMGKQIAEAVRKMLDLRDNVKRERQEIHGINTSLAKQAATVKILDEKYRSLVAEGADMTRMLEVSDEVKAGKQECERVTAQLERKLLELSTNLQNNESELMRVEKEVLLLDARAKGIVRSSRDSYWSWSGALAPGSRTGGNPILKTIMGRQHGWARPHSPAKPPRSALLIGPSQSHFVATRKALLSSRLSHAATINTHISYPVYCLRFDRTGQYFISGADDYLIKVFHLGTGRSCRNKNESDGSRLLRCNYGANLRGAVLVCSLRGHAGVINDIDVSSDNAFLATASVDGDVRVWGLKDGCPVAILRGHQGGANMVSWSKLTPYRLVSTGSDGFARLWDIREACLKRYGAHIGKRPEYQLNLTDEEIRKSQPEDQRKRHANVEGTPLPAIPVRDVNPSTHELHNEQSSRRDSNVALAESAAGLVVPPLPAAVPPLPPDVPNNEVGNQDPPPGQFVANDEIDEGVKLLAKYKHGSTGPEVQGPGTRSRRTAVNVICVARCPFGYYFATGSDDGICRVFEDDEEPGVVVVDSRVDNSDPPNAYRLARKSSSSRSSDEPLLKLMGHVSAITDLSYSNNGDRIVSASQKDGVVRIWSLGKQTLERKSDGGVSQIVIKLTDCSQPHVSRRTHGGSNRSDTSKVSCDVAVWTHDDLRIITSQSVLVKQSGSEIQPGSQYIFLWDSRTGQCLIGISGAHTMQCPVVVPHPSDSSLICTAGADGVAKVWDWESGRCIFTHFNKVDFGPVEPAEKSKAAGYLDGSFNPDGTMIILTDDSGRLTILDSSAPDQGSDEQSSWMREQYFANDYYELYYDRNGYCVERGSERPPHLAPRGVRCSHSGSPWSDEVNETFSKLAGPSPLPEHICRWHRAEIRRKGMLIHRNHSAVAERQAITVRRGVREFDPLSTIVIKASGHVENTGQPYKDQRHINDHSNQRRNQPSVPSARASSRTMSANYRYLDYDDMIRLQDNQEDEEPDSDDEEFNPTAQNRETLNDSDESDDEMELEDVSMEQSLPPSRRRSQTETGDRQERARRRTQRRNTQFVEVGSDDENDEQIMSTNNTPSGPFIRDYIDGGHFWRMPSGKVRSRWLKRKESDTSYEGRKIYTPQLGDSIVYIPRAHYETINGFPSLEPPWQRWPQGTAWPVVRCCVRGVRFRFPYQDYYRASRHSSIVAILTLEVTGIPELSDNREFPWPKPGFIEPTRAFVFELSVFENDKCEYIFPEGLYTERLTSLESALRGRNSLARLPVSVFYEIPRASEDAPMEASQGVILALMPEDDSTSDPHMSGSGFGIVKVEFDSGEWVEDFSPWDLCMADLSIPRPHLSEDDQKLVLENLNVQCRKPIVAQHFNMPVDTVRYCDYERMVEVEMCLMVVKRRLREDYYASKFSVIQDLRLIRDNCMKYNGAEHELAAIASVMCEEFEAGVLTNDEVSFLKESDSLALSWNLQSEARRVPTIRINLRQRRNRVSAHNHQANQETTGSRPLARLQRQSSLETLPAPELPPARVTRRGRVNNEQTRSSGRQTRSMDPTIATHHESATQRRSLRSRGPAPNLESLSRLSTDSSAQNNATHSTSGVTARPLRVGRLSSRRDANISAHQENHGAVDIDQRNSANTLRANRRTTRACVQLKERDSDDDSGHDDGNSSGEENQQDVSRTVHRRSTRVNAVQQKAKEEENSENDSKDEDLENETVESYSDAPSYSNDSDNEASRQSSRRAAERTSTRSSPRAKRSLSAVPSGKSATRKSRRKSTSVRVSYEEPSDFEPDEDEVESESEEEVSKSSGRRRKVKSYAELPSDFDEEEDFSEEDRKPKSSRPKRKRQASPVSKRVQTKKGKSPQQEKVHLKPWPRIELKHITPVCKSMISAFSAEDQEGIFSIPVLESNPEIADAYLELIKEPMDLRTIEEERIPQYESIKELQDDLVKMLENCCDYNGTDSYFGQYAL